ncbi:unnamed protein product [Macrosiphum euphorbiae]|uniref:J domain-containing protein n=1 Tax=Macrosiphum euphorbiae TaxID=13131 RepID=A0AAV0WGC5_9HEMI|nr:unnamed protein product [Macrosiphum euphorbiae]
MDSDLKDLDLYRILGIKRSATKKEIKTAYRRKALQCHPDKNPDNQNAAQVFLWLTEILNILTDTAARLDYDKLLLAKSAAKLLKKERDSDVAKLINDIFKRTKHERSVQRDTDKRSLKVCHVCKKKF